MYGPEIVGLAGLRISNLNFRDPLWRHEMHCRFKQGPPLHWSVIPTSLGVAIIVLLVGHILHAAVNRIEKVEDDYLEMRSEQKQQMWQSRRHAADADGHKP